MKISHRRQLTPLQVSRLVTSPYAHPNTKHACQVLQHTGKPAIFKLPATRSGLAGGWWEISLTEDMTK